MIRVLRTLTASVAFLAGVVLADYLAARIGIRTPSNIRDEAVFYALLASYTILLFAASFVGVFNHRRAAFVLLFSAGLGTLGAAFFGVWEFLKSYTPAEEAFLPLIFICTPLLLLAALWYFAFRLNRMSSSPKHTFSGALWLLAACSAFTAVSFLGTFLFQTEESGFPLADCGGRPLYTKPNYPNSVAFTATIEQSFPLFPHAGPYQIALATVGHEFWGLRLGSHHYVLVLFPGFHKGATYFVDATSFNGILSRYLPAVTRVDCGWTDLAARSLELRTLETPVPAGKVRIIGKVEYEPEGGRYKDPVPGAEIAVTGPQGNLMFKADANGVFDANGLAPGKYVVTTADYMQSGCTQSLDPRMKPVGGCAFSVPAGYRP
jgi:hypothetical protein